MIVTSLFLLSLMCNYMPCDRKYADPQIQDSSSDSSTSQIRFTRSGITKSTVPEGRNKVLDSVIPYDHNLIVETQSGLVEGYRMKIINGRQIYAFEGIPYAEAPVGHLRFRDPHPVKPWAGIKQAKNPGPVCLQYHVRKLVRITGAEDCLTLTVYSIGLPSDLKGKLYQNGYPVIVWIHGGGYFHMSGSEFGPSYLLQEDLVLVTLNFRQGALGFLSTADEESPGNQGLKDQALALKWISENVAAFGGDNKRITLMVLSLKGSSTGSSAVHLHMMSPLSKHLFHRAISLSGTAFNHWAVNTESRSLRLTRKLAERIGCPTTAGSRVLMDCFRATNPYFLLYEQQRLYDFMTFPPILFAPVVERPGPQAFLPDTPENLYMTNQVAPIPYIISQLTDESKKFALVVFKHAGKIPFYQRNFDRFAPFILDYWYIAQNASDITLRIREAYFGKDGPNPNSESTIRTVSDLISDRYFRCGIHRAIHLHAKIGLTYALIFSPQWEEGTLDHYGHASDTGYTPMDTADFSDQNANIIFSSNFPPLVMGTPNYDVSRMLINSVYNFANKGEPGWKPVTFQGNDFLLIGMENVVMISEPRENAIRFWESLGLPDTPPTIAPSVLPTQKYTSYSQIVTPESLTQQAPPPPTSTITSNNQYSSMYTNHDANVVQTHNSDSVYMNSLNGI